MAVVLLRGGLQDRVAVTQAKFEFRLSHATRLSGPNCQVGLFLVLPPLVLARVAASWWPSALLVHVALLWPSFTR